MNPGLMSVDYDNAGNRFIIKVPFALNEMARAFPNRKWDGKIKAWSAPAIRVNINHIRDSVPPIVLTQVARDFVNQPVGETGPRSTSLFPVDSIKFKYEPRPYQMSVLHRFYDSDAAAVFADMGTGKSKMVIDMAAAKFKAGTVDLLLIFCPVSLRSNWVEQLEIHCPINFQHYIIGGANTTQTKKRELTNFMTCIPPEKYANKLKIAIVGIESLSSSKAAYVVVKSMFNVFGNIFAVVDESHNIKNPAAKRTKAVIGLTRPAKYRWILTGTALSNGLEDLYSQYHFLNEGIMGVGSFNAFKARYITFGGFENRQIIGYKNVPELMELIKPWTVEIRKRDVLPELPEKIYETRPVKLTPEQRQIYLQTRDSGIADLKSYGTDHKTVFRSILQISLALQQIVGGFMSYFDEERNRHLQEIVPRDKNPKIHALLDILEQTYSSTIIWSKYIEEHRQIAEAIKQVYGPDSAVIYNGTISTEARDEAKHKFLQKEARFFVANPTVGGTGLTLNVSDLVIYYSNSFRLTDRLQSEDRNHRIGQKNAVTYIDIPARGTIDTTIMNAIKKKADLLDFVNSAIRDENAASRLRDLWGEGDDNE